MLVEMKMNIVTVFTIYIVNMSKAAGGDYESPP